MDRLSGSKSPVKFDLFVAQQLIDSGTPLVIAKSMPNGKVNPIEKAWQDKTPDQRTLDQWLSGVGTVLGAVMGRTYDVFDFDPQNGCSLAEFLDYYASLGNKSLCVQAITATPSGGHHLWVRTLQKPKRNPITRGVDYQGQRTWVAIPPSRKPSKVTGEVLPYKWLEYNPDGGTGNDSGLAIWTALSQWPNHSPLPSKREAQHRESEKVTRSDVREYRKDGLPPNSDHDNLLSHITFLLCLWGANENVALEIWQDIVDNTELKGREYEAERDFYRHWNGALRKLR